MKPLLILILVIGLVGFSLGYSITDCKQITNQINQIKANESNYSGLRMYAYYSMLANKYAQLGDCYSDIGLDSKEYYAIAGDYFKESAENYSADLEKKYEYFFSCGNMYKKAGRYDDSLSCYASAKKIANEHPELNINPEEVNREVNTLLLNESNPEKSSSTKNLVVWGIGGVIILGLIAGIYYIAKRY